MKKNDKFAADNLQELILGKRVLSVDASPFFDDAANTSVEICFEGVCICVEINDIMVVD